MTRSRSALSDEARAETGTDQVVMEELETVVQLFGEVLRDYHIEPAEVEHCLGVVRNQHYHVLRDTEGADVLAPIGDLIAGSQDTRTVTLRSGAAIVGQTLGEIGFEERGLTVRTMQRGQTHVRMPPAKLELLEGDELALAGTADAFAAAADLFRTDDVDSVEAEGSALPSSAGLGKSVHVYGADWCPLTGGFRGYLKQEGVAYEYHDIEKDPEAEAAVRAMNGGKVKFPMVVLGEYAMKNPPIDELEGALQAAGLLEHAGAE